MEMLSQKVKFKNISVEHAPGLSYRVCALPDLATYTLDEITALRPLADSETFPSGLSLCSYLLL